MCVCLNIFHPDSEIFIKARDQKVLSRNIINEYTQKFLNS